jgi:anthranilate synthase/aminodeoxychorismate synthase-like glutamine amidotransferase
MRGLLGMLGLQDKCFSQEEPPSIVQTRRVPEDEKRRFFGESFAGRAQGASYRRVGVPPKLLLVDNEDSFTFNLEALFSSLGCSLHVIRNRMPMPDLSGYDGIVLSPGPSAPRDAGFLLEYVRRAAGKIPVFGVCLGFQAMVEALGGELGRLSVPLHGKVREVRVKEEELVGAARPQKARHPFLAGLPPCFPVTRYHSLYAARMPAELILLADDDAGIPMALAGPAHWPAFFGVQFHPESFLTGDSGVTLVSNWLTALGTHTGSESHSHPGGLRQ